MHRLLINAFLVLVNQQLQLGCQTQGEHLGNNLRETVYHGDGPKVTWARRTGFLWQVNDDGVVQSFQTHDVAVAEFLDYRHDVTANDVPGGLIELARESVWTGRTIRRHLPDCRPNFFSADVGVQVV